MPHEHSHECTGCRALFDQRHEIGRDMSSLLQEATRCAQQASESNTRAEQNAEKVEKLTDEMRKAILEFTRAMAEQTVRLSHGTEKFYTLEVSTKDLDARVRALEGPGKGWWPAAVLASIPTFLAILAWLKR